MKKKKYVARLHPVSMAVVQVYELLGEQRDNNNNLILTAKEVK